MRVLNLAFIILIAFLLPAAAAAQCRDYGGFNENQLQDVFEWATDVAVQGDYTYVVDPSESGGLFVLQKNGETYDVAAHLTTTTVGKATMIRSSLSNKLYIISQNSKTTATLYIVNIINPTSPTVLGAASVGSTFEPFVARDMEISGLTVAVKDEGTQMAFFDIVDPAVPSVEWIDPIGYCSDFQFRKPWIFTCGGVPGVPGQFCIKSYTYAPDEPNAENRVVEQTSVLTDFTVSSTDYRLDPRQMVMLERGFNLDLYYSMYISGVVDEKPAVIGLTYDWGGLGPSLWTNSFCQLPDGGAPRSLALSGTGTALFMACDDPEPRVFDLDFELELYGGGVWNMGSTTMLSRRETQPSYNLSSSDCALFGACNCNGLQVYEFNPSDVLAGETGNFYNNATACISGDFAYIIDWGGLYIVDISDPETMVFGQFESMFGDVFAAGDVLVTNDRLCAGMGGELVIVDVSDKALPIRTFIGNVGSYGSNIKFLADLGGNRIATFCDEYLKIIDISDPAVPTLVAEHANPFSSPPILRPVVRGNYLYARVNDGLGVLNFSNPANPVASVVNLGVGINALKLHDDRLYIGRSGDGFAIASLANPAVPSLVTQSPVLSVGMSYDHLAYDGVKYLYCVDNMGTCDIIDIANETSPTNVVTVGTEAGNTVWFTEFQDVLWVGLGNWLKGIYGQCGPPPAPVTIYPTASTTTTDTTPLLRWYIVSGADRYRVQVDNDQAFNSPDWSTETTGTSATANLSIGAWYWRVAARNGYGWGPYSDGVRFKIEATGCPLISTFDGQDYQPQNTMLVLDEIRTENTVDHILVQDGFSLEDGVLDLRISENAEETTTITGIEVFLVDNGVPGELYCSSDGTLLRVDERRQVTSIVSSDGQSQLQNLMAKDGQAYESQEDGALQLTLPAEVFGQPGAVVIPLMGKPDPGEDPYIFDSGKSSDYEAFPTLKATLETPDGEVIRQVQSPARDFAGCEMISWTAGEIPPGTTPVVKVRWTGEYEADEVFCFTAQQQDIPLQPLALRTLERELLNLESVMATPQDEQLPLVLRKGDTATLGFHVGEAAAQVEHPALLIRLTGHYSHDEDEAEIYLPQITRLHSNFPNPFNPSTTIRYELARESEVQLRIYDVMGHQVRLLYEGRRPQGVHTEIWNGRNDDDERVASGIYFCRFVTADRTSTLKMTLVK